VLVQYIDKRFYGQYNHRWDDKALRQIILQHISPDARLLDVGAGAGIVPEMDFKGLVANVVGVDPDPRVTSNPYLDEAVVGSAESMPFPDNTFDIVISDNVFEHVQHPEIFMSALVRVLKPGGVIIAKTPNKWHYVCLISRLTPLWFHKFYNELRGRRGDDTFGTFYKLNTRSDVSEVAFEAGLFVDRVEFLEGRPEYLRLYFLTYIFGLTYERIVNFFKFLSSFRCVMIVVLRKNITAAR
jgi:SAM-dependent methyltransferase